MSSAALCNLDSLTVQTRKALRRPCMSKHKGERGRKHIAWTYALTPQVSTPCYLLLPPGLRGHVPLFPSGLASVKFSVSPDPALSLAFFGHPPSRPSTVSPLEDEDVEHKFPLGNSYSAPSLPPQLLGLDRFRIVFLLI